MPKKFQNKYRIESTRLQNWDYGRNASYFVTICTKDREHYFGNVVDSEMELSKIGILAYNFWMEIPNHFSFVKLGASVVMPNHIHGIITIDKKDSVRTGQCPVRTKEGQEPISILTPRQKRFRNQGKNTLSSIVGSYKSVVARNARKIIFDFGWQERFYDNIIRDKKAYHNISKYIENNPSKWEEDKFH